MKDRFTSGVAAAIAVMTLLLINVFRTDGLEKMIAVYRMIYDHRYYTSQHGMPGGWFWQYLLLSGITLLLAMLVIRLTEFRGKAAQVARHWECVRRFGFIAFTIYTIQWVYFLMHYLVSESLGYEPYAKLTWGGTWLVVASSLVVLHLLMRVWERFGYVGSIEWAIVSLTNLLSPIKKQVSQLDQAPRWYERGLLDVKGVIYGPNWKNLDSTNNTAEERKLLWRLSIIGLFVWPFSLIGYSLTRSFSIEHPGENVAGPRILSMIGLIACLAVLAGSCLLSIRDLYPGP